MEELYKDILLQKYQQNSCTPEEYQWVITWFLTPEGQVFLSDSIDRDLLSPDITSPLAHGRSDKVFNTILLKINPDSPVIEQKPFFLNLLHQHWFKVAAVWIAVLFAGSFGFYIFRHSQLVTEQTGYGKIKTVELPDHSLVTLNANSQLQYRAVWNSTLPREVWLKGEAFFSVTHQKNHQKFLVHTFNKFNVEVLGTKFNVLDRPHQFQVVLNTGKIRLSSEKNDLKGTVTMKPGQLIELQHTHQLHLKKAVDTQLYSSWKNRILQFDQANLADISRILKDTYGLKLEISDSTLLKNHISGSVPMDNQDVLIEGISQLFHIRLVRENDHLIIQH